MKLETVLLVLLFELNPLAGKLKTRPADLDEQLGDLVVPDHLYEWYRENADDPTRREPDFESFPLTRAFIQSGSNPVPKIWPPTGGSFSNRVSGAIPLSGIMLGSLRRQVSGMDRIGIGSKNRLARMPIKLSGGRPEGIVRHGKDWTYCLVLPNGHPSFPCRLWTFMKKYIGQCSGA